MITWRSFKSWAAVATLGAVAIFTSSAAHAELKATPLTGDARLVEFEYDEDNVFLVLGRPKRSVFVQFAKDETITYVSAGDTKDFDITVSKSKQFIEVKPRFEKVETNATVVTTKRQYHMVLRSTTDQGKWYARVSWKYPQSNLMDLTERPEVGAASTDSVAVPLASDGTVRAGVDLKKLNFDYTVEGTAEFAPLQVFDDGVFTFIRLKPGLQDFPALFAGTSKELALVNYDVKGDYLVAQRVMKSAVLKLGKEEVLIKAKRRWSLFGSEE
jgi:type IV secretion system protein VirB9